MNPHPLAASSLSLPPSVQGQRPFGPASTTNTQVLLQKGKHRRATRKQMVFYSFLLLRGRITTRGRWSRSQRHGLASTRTRWVGGEGSGLIFHPHDLQPLAVPSAAGLCGAPAGLQPAAQAPDSPPQRAEHRVWELSQLSEQRDGQSSKGALPPGCPQPQTGWIASPAPARDPVQGLEPECRQRAVGGGLGSWAGRRQE